MLENTVTACSGSDMEETYSALKPLQVAVQRWSKSDITRVLQSKAQRRTVVVFTAEKMSEIAHYARQQVILHDERITRS